MHLLRKRPVLLLVVTALLASGAAVRAQQGGDVTVIIKAKSKPSALPTLLVMCDLVCNWKLDGVVKGQIAEGGATKVKVDPGQHMVEATTEDGVDQVKQPSTVKSTGQTMVSIELWPIRYARLIGEQEAREKAAQEAQAKTEREAREKAEQEARDKAARAQMEQEEFERESAAREEREGSRGVWTDTTTGLMWTKKDNGTNITWQPATAYCGNLQLDGHSDWRLPTIDELQGIYEKSVKGHLVVKGHLILTYWFEWSSTPKGTFKDVWAFSFDSGQTFPIYRGRALFGNDGRALCVRRSVVSVQDQATQTNPQR